MSQKLFDKVEMKQEPVTASDTRKIDMSIMGFRIAILRPKVQKTSTVNNAKNEYCVS